MNELAKKYTVLLAIFSLMAIAVFYSFHVAHQADAYSLCLVMMCAFVMTSAGVSFSLAANPFNIITPVDHGVTISLNLEKPPRL